MYILFRTLPYVETFMFKPNGTKSAKVQRVMLSPKKVAQHQATVHEVLDLFIAGHIYLELVFLSPRWQSSWRIR